MDYHFIGDALNCYSLATIAPNAVSIPKLIFLCGYSACVGCSTLENIKLLNYNIPRRFYRVGSAHLCHLIKRLVTSILLSALNIYLLLFLERGGWFLKVAL